ncbi:hypothetical protein DENSPDRAFT_794096 [Dentipellis sp. KUC8613]|nr:hypothetical protein DENSPDRAFT_794096 [Dentipellis sp. KUC8613]
MIIARAANKHSTLLLDFLVPGLARFRPKSTKAKSSRARTWSPSHANSTSPSRHTHASKIVQGDNDVAGKLSARVQTFRWALEQNDIPLVFEAWKALEDQFHLLGLPVIDSLSRFVVSHCPLEPQKHWPHAEMLERMALATAQMRSYDALRTCLLAHVKRGNPDGALSLYNMFLGPWLVEHASKQKEAAEVDWDPDLDVNLPEEGLVQERTPPRASEIVLLAVIAQAMKDDFNAAIHLAIEAPFTVDQAIIPDLLEALDLPAAIQPKASAFIAHTMTAQLFRKSHDIAARINALSTQSSFKRLAELRQLLMEGLSDKYPWLASNPSQVSKQRPLLMEETVWAALIRAYLRLGRMEDTEAIWDDMIRMGVVPTIRTWTTLLLHIGNLKGADRALETFNTMKAAGITPSAANYRILISFFSQERKMQEAVELFKEFQSTKLAPPMSPLPSLSVTAVYNKMLQGYLHASQAEDARNLLEQMRTNGPKPDVTSYNTFLFYYHSTKDYRRFSSTLKAIVADGLRGDVVTFSTLLSAYLQIRPRDEAISAVVRMMQKHGVEPNVVTYTSIISNLLKEREEGALRAALDVLRMMEEDSDPQVAPNVVTYTSILTGVYTWEGLDRRLREECAEYALRKMKEKKIRFTTVTYNILISAMLKNRDPKSMQQALEYYREMRRERVPMSQDTWFILLRGLLDRDEVVLAEGIANEFEHARGSRGEALERLVEKVKLKASWLRSAEGVVEV